MIGRNVQNLQKLKGVLLEMAPHQSILASNDIKEADRADIIVMATSAHNAILDIEGLKKGVLIYDITQPKNTPENIKEMRPDVKIFDGGLIKLPSTIKINFNFGLPENVVFSCLAETIILTAIEYQGNFCTNGVDYKKIELIADLAKKHGFVSYLQSVNFCV